MQAGDRVLGNVNVLPAVWRGKKKHYLTPPRMKFGVITAVQGDTFTVTSPCGKVYTEKAIFWSKMAGC